MQCTGLISTNVDKLYKPPAECILNKVRGARIYSPSKKELFLSRPEYQAYVIDRSIFDKSLTEGLEDKIETGKKVEHLKLDSKYIIGADGPNSTVAKLSGFPEIEDKGFGIQYVIPRGEYDPDFVELHFGNDIAPNFFAWVVPTDEHLRVGLGCVKNPQFYLDKFMKEHFPNSEIFEKNAGIVPLKPRSIFQKENIALVGDAAGQVKPTTGGGVNTGFLSAVHLARAIKEDQLDRYPGYWKKDLGNDFSINGKIRKIIKNVSDEEMEKIWDILVQDDMKKLIEEYGDMDRPTKLMKAILKNPGLVKFLPYLRYLSK